MGEGVIFTYGDEGLVAHGTGKVLVEDYITLHQDGRVVGKLNATFHFTDVPAEHHVMVANILLRNAMSISLLPSSYRNQPSFLLRTTPDHEKQEVSSWWDRFKRIFK